MRLVIRSTVLNKLFALGVSLLFLYMPFSAHAATFVRTLQVGSSGTDVSALQQYLKNAGIYSYPLITGYYGVITKAAVTAFQAVHGLEQVGIVGPKTRALLNGIGGTSASTPSTSGVTAGTVILTHTLSLGMTGIDVSALQEFLVGQGLLTSDSITGYFGPLTKAAVTAFQAAHGLEQVGIVGPLTRATIATTSTSTSAAGSGGMGSNTETGNSGITSGHHHSHNSSPDDTVAPVISAVSSGTPGMTSVTVTWSTDEAATSIVNYGATSSYGSASSSDAVVTSHSITLTGLTAGTTYHFQVGGEDEAGNASASSDQTFTTSATPDTTAPVISSVSVSTTTTSATISWTTNEAASSTVNYGTSSSYGTASTSASLVTSHSITLTGLSAATTYHYQVGGADAAGNVSTSTDLTFQTASSVTGPTVSTSAASSVTSSSAVLNGSISATGGATPTSRGFQIGTSAAYGATTTESGTFTTGAFATTTTGLSAATLYHYRSFATNAAGTAYGSDVTFTTSAAPDTTAPVISAIATSTTSSTATITWTTNEAASSTVNYGASSSYGTASTSASLVTSHSITLTGLSAATTYHYQVGGADAAGNVSTSSDAVFTTDAGIVPDGTITAASIESNGYIADISVKGLNAGGTYSLTPDTSPKLVFDVTSSGYNSSGNSTTVSRTVYGTIAARMAYPNAATTTESVNGSTLTSQVYLSDDILPGDTVTLTGSSGWYTQATSTAAVSSLAVTNSSAASQFRPVGAWVTPTNLRRASSSPFTVEFSVVSKFPRNNGQVAAVKFTASDGSNTVTKTVSTMTQSTYLTSTTCTATSGSAVLTSCSNTEGFISGHFVTVTTGSVSGVNIGNPKILTVDSTTQLTLTTNASVSGTVTVTVGAPVYVYAATFTSGEMAGLAQGTTTVKAVAYSNVGDITLDTSAGPDGATPLAASTISPNLKSLQFLNDKNDSYVPVYAWVSPSGAGASPAVQVSAADPGSTAYYASIKTAADALKTYYNANKGHNNACGGVIYLKVGTTTGFGGDLGSTGSSPTNCATYLTISAEPGHGPSDTFIEGAASGNRGAGYTTIIQNVRISDTATNKVVISGPDGSNTNPRLAHTIFKNTYLLETQSSPSAFINQVAWREYYNSILDMTTGDPAFMRAFSTTGVTQNEFGSTLLGVTSGGSDVQGFTVLGNISSRLRVVEISTTTSANYIGATSMLVAFNKFLNASENALFMTADQQTKYNYAFVQNVFENVGTAAIQPAYSFAADDDVNNAYNILRSHNTVVGARTNLYYNSLGGSPLTRLAAEMFNIDFERNTKSDYFSNLNDRYVTTITVTNGGSGYTTPPTVTIGTPAGTNPVTALAHSVLSGDAVGSIALDITMCGNTGGVGYTAAPSVTITGGGGTGATATASISSSGTGQPCGSRIGNWRQRFGVGSIGEVVGTDSTGNSTPSNTSWLGDYFGLPGNTTTPGYNQTSFTWMAANQNSASGGNNTGFGWYKPNTTTGLTNRVPSGWAGFPGDIEGVSRKNDGTGCAGAYEC